MLPNWVLHGARALTLLPLRLAGWESPYLLLLPRTCTCRWPSRVAHYVVAVQSSTLSDHCGESTSIGQHFLLICASYKIVGDKTLFLWASLLIALVGIICTSSCLILPLTLDIDWRLRSYSVLGWGRTRFLGVTSLLGNHLAIESMLLISSHVATEQIIVLLSQTKRVRWRTIDIVATLFGKTLSVWTCWSLLCGSWTQAIIVVILSWSKTSLTSLVSLVCVWVRATGHTFSISHSMPLWLDGMILVHLIIESCGTYRSTWFEYAKLLLIQYLRVCKSLVGVSLSKIRRAHYLLRHHKIVCLGPIDSLLALNGAYTELGVL